jgi:methyltransferase (TIGR00027 family)
MPRRSLRPSPTNCPARYPSPGKKPPRTQACPGIPLADHLAVRSKFFDDVLSAAAGNGVRQLVILAAGLDTRAFRLDWARGTTVYEIDASMVLEFKDAVLAAHGAVPGCERRTVAADLREDWPAALIQAGFDPAMPTAWLAEGLFPYLPDEAIDALLGHVHALSVPGSLIALEHLPGGTSTLDDSLSQPITTGKTRNSPRYGARGSSTIRAPGCAATAGPSTSAWSPRSPRTTGVMQSPSRCRSCRFG